MIIASKTIQNNLASVSSTRVHQQVQKVCRERRSISRLLSSEFAMLDFGFLGHDFKGKGRRVEFEAAHEEPWIFY